MLTASVMNAARSWRRSNGCVIAAVGELLDGLVAFNVGDVIGLRAAGSPRIDLLGQLVPLRGSLEPLIDGYRRNRRPCTLATLGSLSAHLVGVHDLAPKELQIATLKAAAHQPLVGSTRDFRRWRVSLVARSGSGWGSSPLPHSTRARLPRECAVAQRGHHWWPVSNVTEIASFEIKTWPRLPTVEPCATLR